MYSEKDKVFKIVSFMVNKYNINCNVNNVMLNIKENVMDWDETIKTRKNNLNLPDDERCLGRKADNIQCTRRKKRDGDYCASHLKRLPCGHINDGLTPIIKEKGKRGRKKKECNNDDKYIETWVDNELGNLYLVDKHNLVYRKDTEYPELVGIKKNGKIEDLDDIPEYLF